MLTSVSIIPTSDQISISVTLLQIRYTLLAHHRCYSSMTNTDRSISRKYTSTQISSPVRLTSTCVVGPSALGRWAYVLFLTVNALANNGASPSLLTRLSSYVPSTLPWTSNSRTTNALSKYLQVLSLAALEVLHVLVGLVRSPLPTTLMQVSSRLVLVWAIVARFPLTHSNPFYTTMVVAWSLSEIPRYIYYVFSLAGIDAPAGLTWLRYSAFYVLYPIGAGSEAVVALSTLPEWQNGQYANWVLEDWLRAGMVLIWIPGLYVMYTHMIRTRSKVLGGGKGRKLGAKPKDRAKAE
ncbi:PTPLA-domain-containing protein [Melanogaster broomeanus]|nr:PTPLA-domain-containing protein [Melanogaster broomeanus]